MLRHSRSVACGPTGDENEARVFLRPPSGGDEGEFLDLVRASASLHHPCLGDCTYRRAWAITGGTYR